MKIPNIEFGEPWRYNEKFFGIIVPILRKISTKRNYVTLEEVEDKVKFTDTGQIDKSKISSASKTPVFMRMGTMLKGEGTQSRATTGSIVIMPEIKEMEVPVKCIHQSHGISSGSVFKPSGTAPPAILCCLSSRSQSNVWGGVQKLSNRATSGGTLDLGTGDNLIRTTEKIGDFKKDINDIIKKAPKDEPSQIGVVILDFEGVVGFEAFDSSKSWQAVSEDVIRKYGDTLSKKQEEPLFELKKEAVIPKITNFMDKLDKGTRTTTFEVKEAKTVLVKSDGVIGEYTQVKGRTIHIIGLKEEKNMPSETISIATLSSTPTTTTGYYTEGSTTSGYYGTTNNLGKGTYDLLTSIDQGKNRWKYLKQSTQVSQGTLSKRLNSCEDLGLITKNPKITLGKLGVEYNLTDTGKTVLQNLSAIKKNIR